MSGRWTLNGRSFLYPPFQGKPNAKPIDELKGKNTYSTSDGEFQSKLLTIAKLYFAHMLGVPNNIVAFTLATIKPTYLLDETTTAAAQNQAAARVPETVARVEFKANQTLVHRRNVITERDWQILRAEQKQFVAELGKTAMKSKLGLAGLIALLTVALAVYVVKYQPRVSEKSPAGGSHWAVDAVDAAAGGIGGDWDGAAVYLWRCADAAGGDDPGDCL